MAMKHGKGGVTDSKTGEKTKSTQHVGDKSVSETSQSTCINKNPLRNHTVRTQNTVFV
jgi:hypothetical protein